MWPKRLTLLLGSAAVVIAACNYVPKGAILFKVADKREYDRAEIAYAPSAGETRLPLRLKWIDTNSWVTTASLAPGTYILTARTYEGAYYAHEVEIKTGQNRYDLPATTQNNVAFQAGPKVNGTLLMTEANKAVRELVIVFIGPDVTVRRVHPVNGQFSADAPAKGKFNLEIHAPGEQPRSFMKSQVDLTKDADLGQIDLR
jgi:hypothetical protein